MKAACGGELEWRGCYSGQYDLWTAESYAHPAKCSPALAFRILAHLEELGLLQSGMTVLDPLCGIGTSLLAAAIRGYRAVGVELESRFVSMARANAERIALKGFGAPIEVIQGDARHLSELLAEKGMVSVVSPPYTDAINSSTKGGIDWSKNKPSAYRPSKAAGGIHFRNPMGVRPLKYGETPGQIGSLPDSVTLTSPPYEDSEIASLLPTSANPEMRRHKRAEGTWQGYGSAPGQIGNLPDAPITITSPPYIDADNRGREDQTTRGLTQSGSTRGGPLNRQDYGTTEGQIGALPDTVTVTSPPYEDAIKGGVGGIDNQKSLDRFGRMAGPHGQGRIAMEYGQAEGQVGRECQESYLEAMRLVYAEIAKVSPILVVVVKDPTRAGKLRLLGQDTWLLMEQAGYHIVDYHRSILFEEQEQGHLFDGSVKQPRGRLGFFKRLAYRKGSQVANFEHVLIGGSA